MINYRKFQYICACFLLLAAHICHMNAADLNRYNDIASSGKPTERQVVFVFPQTRDIYNIKISSNDSLFLINMSPKTSIASNDLDSTFNNIQSVTFVSANNKNTSNNENKNKYWDKVLCYHRLLDKTNVYYVMLAQNILSFDLIDLFEYLQREEYALCETLYVPGNDLYMLPCCTDYSKGIESINEYLSCKLHMCTIHDAFGQSLHDIELTITHKLCKKACCK